MSHARAIEILTFAGCPNAATTQELVERVIAELHVNAHVVVVDVPDVEAAGRLRFLGSPTVRVDGVDIEPGADTRGDYVLACRLYRTEAGASGSPNERWLRDALAGRDVR